MKKAFEKPTRRKFLKKMTLSLAAVTLGYEAWGNILDPSKGYPNDLKILSAGRIGSLRLKNRLIRAATLERAGLNGFPTDTYLKMFETQAAGGVSLIITGAMAIAIPTVSETQIHIYDDQYIPGLQKIVRVVRQSDKTCKIIAQLVHVDNNLSPSGISWNSKKTIGIMSPEQIKSIITSFSKAIIRAKLAGFDGVELNGHSVYLLSSFLSPHTNKRTDDYGGSVENRVRLVREIVEQARTKVGKKFPIMIKLNCDDSFLTTTIEDGININNFHLLASEIEKAGFDAIELSGNTMIRKDILTKEKESYFADYADNLDLSIPVILTGGNRTLGNIEDIIRRGKIDFFGFARPFIREPDLAKRWSEEGNAVKSKCISCNACLSASGPLHCMQKNE